MNPFRILTRNISSLILIGSVVCVGRHEAEAATVSLNATDAAGTTSFNTGLHWSDGLPPDPANDYVTLNFLLRTPTNAAPITFAGNSLTVSPGGTLRNKTASAVGIANLILSGGTLELTQPNNSLIAAGSLGGGITLAPATTSTIRSGIQNTEANVFTVNSVVSGSGSFTTGAGMFGRLILAAPNTFTGGMTVASGGTAAGLQAGGGSVQLAHANAVQNATVTLSMANGLGFAGGIGTFHLGSLTGNGNNALVDTVGAPVTISVGSNNASTVYGGALSGAGGVTKVGSGTLTFSGTNSYSGATTVTAGTLVFAGTQNLGASVVTVADGAGLGVKTSFPGATVLTASSITFGTAGATNLMFDFNGTSPIVPQISTGDLALNGSITLGVSGTSGLTTNTYKLIDYSGTLSGSLSAFATASFTFGHSSGTLVDNLAETSIDLNVVADSLLWTGAASSVWWTAATGDHSSPNSWATKIGQAATNFWANDGVEFGDSYNVGAGDVAVANRAVDIAGADVNPSGVVFNNSAGDYVISGSFGIAGSGSVIKNGSGKVTIRTANSYTGGTTINEGTIAIENVSNLGASSGAVLLNSGTLQTTSDIETTRNITLGSATSTIQVDAGTTFAANGVLSGAGTLNKSGDGVLTLTANNSFTGGTKITGGTISLIEAVFNSVKLGMAPAFATPNHIVLDGGGIAWNATVDDSFGATRGIGLGPDSGAIGGTGFFDVAAGRLFTIFGVVASAGNTGENTLVVNGRGGSGILALNGFNTYDGATTVNGGILRLNAGGMTGAIRGTLNINPGATVELGAIDALGYGLGTSVTQINITGGLLNNAVAGNNGAIASWVLTGGAMTSTGGGAFNLNYLNSGNGISSIAHAATATISAPLMLRGGGGVQIPIDVADGSAPIDVLISGSISENGAEGSNGISKTGAGTLELAGFNTHTGTTSVDEGTLLLTGTLSGSVTVNGGIFAGTGLAGAVTVASAGTIAPGQSGIGPLSTSDLELSGEAKAVFEISTSDGLSDRIDVNGILSLDPAGTATLSIADLSLSTPLPEGTIFTLIDYSSAWNGGIFAGHPDDSVFTIGVNQFRISYDGVDNADTAVVLVVPEPSATALLAGVGLLAARRRLRAR